MRLTANEGNETSRIKVQIKKIVGDIIECRNVASNYLVKAFINKNMHFEIGQVVLLEFRRGPGGGGYIVVDDLMEEVKACVLEAQHIISDGKMYTSLILENTVTKQRMHSLVPSTNNLFGSTSIIITGDEVTLLVNNGNLFSIKY